MGPGYNQPSDAMGPVLLLLLGQLTHSLALAGRAGWGLLDGEEARA